MEVAELPDGRYVLQAVGVRRIRVQSWLADDPYPRAEVEEWPDEDAEPRDERAAWREVADRGRRVRALASELREGAGAARRSTIADDPLLASYHLLPRWPRSAPTTATSCSPAPARSSAWTGSTTCSARRRRLVLELPARERGRLTAGEVGVARASPAGIC